MSDSKKYYEILGVSPTDDLSTIKKAYKKLVLEHHPDKSTGNQEKFIQIQEAYEVLSDEEKRNRYDHPPPDPFSMFQGFPFSPFSSPFPSSSPSHIETIICPISLKEIWFGCVKNISYERRILQGDTMVCEHCKGAGGIQQQVQQGPFMFVSQLPCPACQGVGKKLSPKASIVLQKETIECVFPRGVRNQTFYHFPNKGHVNLKTEQYEEIRVMVQYALEEKDFSIDSEFRLVYQKSLSCFESITGTDIVVPLPSGEQKITLTGPVGKSFQTEVEVFSSLLIQFSVSLDMETTQEEKEWLKEKFKRYY